MPNLTLVAVAIAISAGTSISDRSEIPPEFHGVWKVTSATRDGVDMPMPIDGGGVAGECQMMEVIICKHRVVLVKQGGKGDVFNAWVTRIEPDLKIELELLGSQVDPRRFKHCALIKPLEENKMQISFCPPDADRVNIAPGGHQYVVTVERQ